MRMFKKREWAQSRSCAEREDMETKIVTITPDEARKFLANNPSNRHISENEVAKLAADMKEGRWMVTHQGIAISKTGRLLDGQHRLTAVIKAGIPVQMMVTFDVDEDAVEAIDRGRRRSIADVFTFEGEEPWMRQSAVVAAASLLVRKEQRSSAPVDSVRKLMYEYPKAFSAIYSLLCCGNKVRAKGLINASVNSALAAALICGVSEPDIAAFYDLYVGNKIPDGKYNINIVLRFKEYMLTNKPTQVWQLHKLTSNVIWNFVKNTKTTLLRTPDTERYVVNV